MAIFLAAAAGRLAACLDGEAAAAAASWLLPITGRPPTQSAALLGPVTPASVLYWKISDYSLASLSVLQCWRERAEHAGKA